MSNMYTYYCYFCQLRSRNSAEDKAVQACFSDQTFVILLLIKISMIFLICPFILPILAPKHCYLKHEVFFVLREPLNESIL